MEATIALRYQGLVRVTGAYLPNLDRAIVPERKVTAYLLSETHPEGHSKARFCSRHGF